MCPVILVLDYLSEDSQEGDRFKLKHDKYSMVKNLTTSFSLMEYLRSVQLRVQTSPRGLSVCQKTSLVKTFRISEIINCEVIFSVSQAITPARILLLLT